MAVNATATPKGHSEEQLALSIVTSRKKMTPLSLPPLPLPWGRLKFDRESFCGAGTESRSFSVRFGGLICGGSLLIEFWILADVMNVLSDRRVTEAKKNRIHPPTHTEPGVMV
jgi:hypothetical protein